MTVTINPDDARQPEPRYCGFCETLVADVAPEGGAPHCPICQSLPL